MGDREAIEPVDGRSRLRFQVRIRCDFEGIRPEDVKLYAVYLESAA